MIKTLILGFALSTGLAAIISIPAYAQTTAPVTDQTDRSEEDWRKSKKKKNTSDIFEDIIDTRSTGWGGIDRPLTPMETLPEDSQRHLQKERAKLLAEADVDSQGQIKSLTDTRFNPSEEAKSDPELAEQEKEAWDVIVTDLKGGGNAQPGEPQDGPNKVAVVGQGGGSGKSQRGNSTMRGGSSQSVADILAQIKDLQSAGGGGSSQGPVGSGGQSQGEISEQGSSQGAQQVQQRGQSTGPGQASGQSSQGQQAAQNDGQGQQQAQQGQSQSEQAAQGQSQSESQDDSSANSQTQAESNAQSSAESQAQAEAQAQAQAQETPRDTISPLDRIKSSRDQQTSGRRTSASDYLNTED